MCGLLIDRSLVLMLAVFKLSFWPFIFQLIWPFSLSAGIGQRKISLKSSLAFCVFNSTSPPSWLALMLPLKLLKPGIFWYAVMPNCLNDVLT